MTFSLLLLSVENGTTVRLDQSSHVLHVSVSQGASLHRVPTKLRDASGRTLSIITIEFEQNIHFGFLCKTRACYTCYTNIPQGTVE